MTDVWIGGSVATGDHRVGVSDVDLVALVDGPMDAGRVAAVRSLHVALDEGVARGLQLGCVYVDAEQLPVVASATRRGPTGGWSSAPCRRLRARSWLSTGGR